jgi:hypothetical protein
MTLVLLLAALTAQPPKPTPPALPERVSAESGPVAAPPALGRFVAIEGRVYQEMFQYIPVTEVAQVPVTTLQDGKPVTTMQTVERTRYVPQVMLTALEPKGVTFTSVGGAKLTYPQAAAKLAGLTVCLVAYADLKPDDPYLKPFKDNVLIVRLTQVPGVEPVIPPTSLPELPRSDKN